MKRILALGGGGFLMEDTPSPIDQYILELANKPKPRVCFVSTPSGDLPEHIEKFYTAYSAQDCEPSHLAFFRKPIVGSVALAKIEEHLLAQDVIFIGGGNTKSALGVWREWGLDSTFSRALSSGALLTGMSAGAMCWFDYGLTDSFWGAGYQPLPCLGLLPGACGVHYNSDTERKSRLFAAIKAGAIPASIAIDDYAAVLYEAGTVVRVLSWRNGASAYHVSLQNDQVAEVPYEAFELR